MKLIDVLFDSAPIEEFQKRFVHNRADYDWDQLLHMCYCEESYESVSGDEGYLDNPPINKERVAYLEELVEFLENNGIISV